MWLQAVTRALARWELADSFSEAQQGMCTVWWQWASAWRVGDACAGRTATTPRCNPHLRPYQCQPDSKSALPHVQAASSSSCAVHCRMAAWTWEDVARKIADPALGFSEEEQGLLEAKLYDLHERWAFYLEGTDNKVRGRLKALLPGAGGCLTRVTL